MFYPIFDARCVDLQKLAREEAQEKKRESVAQGKTEGGRDPLSPSSVDGASPQA
jgi:hypothetical protein